MNDELRTILKATPVAHLATLLPDGAPHSVPVWIDVSGDLVLLMTGPDSLKARNLRRDPRLAISLTRPDDPFRSIVLRGRAIEWIDGEPGWEIIDAIAQKYIGSPYPRDDERIVIEVEIDRAVLR